MTNRNIIKEACVEGLEQAIAAEKQGANRIELCSDLHLDGLTPNKETISLVQSKLSIPIRVMVRPRAGNFCYDQHEIEKMKQIIRNCKKLRVEGVVFGVLLADGEINWALTNDLIKMAQPLKTVFHRAVESTRELSSSVEDLFGKTKIDAVLTSGGPGKASDHYEVLRNLITISSDRELVVCGKITNINLRKTHDILQAKSYHGRLIVGSLDG